MICVRELVIIYLLRCSVCPVLDDLLYERDF